MTRSYAKSQFIHQQTDVWKANDALQVEVEQKGAELAALRSVSMEWLAAVEAEKATLTLKLAEAPQATAGGGYAVRFRCCCAGGGSRARHCRDMSGRAGRKCDEVHPRPRGCPGVDRLLPRLAQRRCR
jgi:hypothetical protein